ncbi:gamma-glutamylcyclotransferase [Telluribacter sp. SYSU D00476]|uniref:gamma-glutamylcyclotransferase family protein n=1 Tax=Telluribacter sp. SYSU D00476 TaxID=2811430 RepID=UPI001FF204F8|nr:gamma-glutamylcyclotransferase family protein [Telluribacter sp. SYSU D00476]
MENHQYLFVYGTLMRGYENPFATLLQQYATWVGEGTMTGLLYRISWYPGAIFLDDPKYRVFGEVYQIVEPDALLRELDAYEDVSPIESESLYLRRLVPVQLTTGQMLECWTYLFNKSVAGLEQIIGGNFRS